MKILFTIISINRGNSRYLNYSQNLINEILENTVHDIMVTTNHVEEFSQFIDTQRVVVRNNLTNDLILTDHQNNFNYNLKFLAFKSIPEHYDLIIYLDGDIKLSKEWTDETNEYLKNITIDADVVGMRFNCTLRQQYGELLSTGNALFKHKIVAYNVKEYEDHILDAQLPSEHLLILRNVPDKILNFASKWEEMNSHLQTVKCGTWGDGFEIGVSLYYANYHNIKNVSWAIMHDLGLVFNGNKI